MLRPTFKPFKFIHQLHSAPILIRVINVRYSSVSPPRGNQDREPLSSGPEKDSDDIEVSDREWELRAGDSTFYEPCRCSTNLTIQLL